MPECPRCHQTINFQAINCPHCNLVLKAYGHPGIPLHRATGTRPLCDSCTYHADDTCNFPQRPNARECTLYQDQSQPLLVETKPATGKGFTPQAIQLWIRRNMGWLVLLGLVVLSFLLSLH